MAQDALPQDDLIFFEWAGKQYQVPLTRRFHAGERVVLPDGTILKLNRNHDVFPPTVGVITVVREPTASPKVKVPGLAHLRNAEIATEVT